MKLELAYIHIKELRFGDRTSIENAVLTVCDDELIGLLNEDTRLAGIELEIAAPGEKTRIINVLEGYTFGQRLRWYNQQAAKEGWVCP